MSGKSYTLKEMKTIVDYLVDHKAYGEIKGRKMWMNFSNSQLTNRSWQSLKETFLKRILPDIHNPYYKLSMDQVRSFRKGIDVRENDNNKLEVHTINEDSGSNAENQKDNEQPSTSKYNDEDKTSGEDVKPSQIPSRNRASVDTVVLDNCYDTVEDVLRDLESPSDTNARDVSPKTQSKSIRDLITYSEPLTPMLQEVLHDFATDEETDSEEPKMHIVENEPEAEVQKHISPRKVPEANDVNDNTNENEENVTGYAQDVDEAENFVEPKVKSLRLRKRQGVYVPVNDVKPTQNASGDESARSKNNKADSKLPLVEVSEPSIILSSGINDKTVDTLVKSHVQSSQNCSSSTTDTVLPNNQEALNDKKLPETKNTSNEISDDANKMLGKRATSNDILTNANLLKANDSKTTQKQISASDTDVNSIKTAGTNAKHDESAKNQINEQQVTKETFETNTANETRLPPNKLLTTDDKILNTSTQPSQVNPCLQSMSLFADQFNNYLESESSGSDVNPEDKPKQPLEITKTINNNKVDEVVILKSHSDTDSDRTKRKIKKNTTNSKVFSKAKRDKALANVFGFSSGAVSSKRKKKLSSFRRISAAHHCNGKNFSSESSEWTSESDSDYVSPPRDRRNSRTARKYLKPKSARIHSLEEEGGLFVMYGKKIYPLVKDGKTIKNYAIYSPDSDPDEEENYWKMKYVEERKRVEELKKFITKSQRDIERAPSPLPTNSSRNRATSPIRRSPPEIVISSDNDKEVVPKETVEKKEPVAESKNKTLKITFAKNNQEVHLEGHWSQLHPVLADVVEIFHKDTDAPKEPTVKSSVPNPPVELVREKSPLVLTPIDEDIREKVNKLETEIFKEIEQRDQQEHADTKEQTENNVTKRKRPNKLSTNSSDASNSPKVSPSSSRVSKRAKIPKKTEEIIPTIDREMTDKEADSKEIMNNNIGDEIEKGIKTPLPDQKSSKTSVASIKKQTPKKETRTKETPNLSVATKDNRKRPRRSKPLDAVNAMKKSITADDESEIRYMLPPTKKASGKASISIGKANKSTKHYSIRIPSTLSPPHLSQNSDSTQGYLDSDVSPTKLWSRKKRRLSLSTVLCKNKNKHMRMKRNSYPIITNEASSDSNNSYHIVIKPTNADCSLKSDEYRSESYQILMPHKRDMFEHLEKIEEDPSSIIDCNINQNSNADIIKEKICMNIINDVTPPLAIVNTDVVNSSNISLPLSPEISIVENLTVGKDLINSVNNQHTLNENYVNETTEVIVHNKYLISHIDVSMPLVPQESDIHKKLQGTFKSDFTHNETKNSVESESFLNKINTVNMEEGTSLSVSLDTRLKELLLDSAKKMSIAEENTVEVYPGEVIKKPRSRRCSTPRKKKEIKKTKLAIVDPVIEEECMEYCSYGGRKSCPPTLEVTVDNAINEDITFDKEFIAKDKLKGRKKKDVIKVKITRPKAKIQKDEKNRNKVKNASRASIPINCQINDNESGISIHDTSDGIDLIHNHSDTCLQANECIGDSVEFLEMTAKSIISINSNSTTSCDCKTQQQFDFHDCVDISLFCNNAQDGTNIRAANELVNTEATSDTVFHSPSDISLTSLITEDLSDENPPRPQSTKWYLLGDDETHTNADHNLNASNFGANLKQLFPLTCSVPNLSTITEMSKENEDNSRKTTLEGSIFDSNMNTLDSHGAFDMNLV
ncbi:unnamed protein product [Chilo suppressalis]|uniref:TERF2-interacting telomeric protein 1 Myb domain-containing protein n=1 Tax=Chilo suppressalis TaxID=168631 RepID=A0ABN8L9H6_CHISP|nr:unnamed protein product [Chilo suppressalis]